MSNEPGFYTIGVSIKSSDWRLRLATARDVSSGRGGIDRGTIHVNTLVAMQTTAPEGVTLVGDDNIPVTHYRFPIVDYDAYVGSR